MENKFTPAVADTSPWTPGGRESLTRELRGRAQQPEAPQLYNWMDEKLRNTPGYYPHALLSYYHWRRIAVKLPEDGFIFGDSGGFSVMSLGANIDPRDVLRWQLLLCDVGVVLDVPPVDKYGHRVWDEGLNATVRNTKVALPQYRKAREEGTEFRWWGVVHGWDENDLMVWWKKVSAVYPFTDEGEGWAFKPRPTITPVTVAKNLRFIKRVGIRRAHFLMTTGAPSVVTMLHLGPQAGLEFLTYDSSSAFIAGINRTAFVPRNGYLGWNPLEERWRETKGEDRKVRDYLLEKCDCFSCDRLREEVNTTWPENEEYWKFRFLFHNLLIQLRTFETLRTAVAEDGEAVMKALLGPKKTSTVLRMFDGRHAEQVAVGRPRSLLDMS